MIEEERKRTRFWSSTALDLRSEQICRMLRRLLPLLLLLLRKSMKRRWWIHHRRVPMLLLVVVMVPHVMLRIWVW